MGLEWLCLLFHGLVGPKEKKLMIASFLVLFLFIVFAQVPSCLKLTQLSFKDLIWSNKNSVFSFILQKSIHFQKLYDQINLKIS